MNAWLEPAKQQEGKTCVHRLRELEALGVSAVAVPSGQPKSLEPPPPGKAATGRAEESRHLRQPPGVWISLQEGTGEGVGGGELGSQVLQRPGLTSRPGDRQPARAAPSTGN